MISGTLRGILRRMPNSGALVSQIALAIMLVQIIIDTASRFLFNSPLPGTLDMVKQWWMPVIVFMSLAAAQATDEHVRVTMITENVSPKLRKLVERGILGLALLIVLMLLRYSVIDAQKSMAISEAAVGSAVHVAIWPVKILSSVGLLLLALVLGAQVLRPPSTRLGEADKGHPA